VARADRRRAARARPAAATSRYQSAYVGTEGLFFQRLRRQAKWAFVFLALVFGVGFVVFGVGSDLPSGVADLISSPGASSGPSVDDAREKLADNPNDDQALRDLATALQAEGRPDEAIEPLETFTALRPRNEEALRELAGLYLTRATRLRDELQLLQIEAQRLNPGGIFLPPAGSPFGQALGSGPVTNATTSEVTERLNTIAGELNAVYQSATRTYQQLGRLNPDDPSYQLLLADVATNAGDVPVAIAAYERFIELAPDDRNAPFAREQIKRLRAATAPSAE
jgi:tetratricopeptide (TPR) repeat protein